LCNKGQKLFIFSEKRAANLIEESLVNEKLSTHLIKKYETNSIIVNDIIFAKLCEFFICNRAMYEAVTNIELTKEKRFSEKENSYGYVVEQLEVKALHMLVSTVEMVKAELSQYNINFTVH